MTDTLPALKKTLHVPLSAQEAFDLFTRRIAEWWPVESHSLSAREGKRPLKLWLEPRARGRVLEIRHDGNEAPWAELMEWEEGRKLVLAWHVGRARKDATRIEVTFRGLGSRDTELALIHDGFEKLGAAGEAALTNYDEGWDMILGEHFHRACTDLA